MKFFLPLALATALVVSCAPKVSSPTTSSEPAESTADLSDAKVPVLRSAYFEQNWGLPKITTYSDGGYRLSYRQGTTLNFVQIRGYVSAKSIPVTPPTWSEESSSAEGLPTLIEHPQKWRTATILGKRVKWYQRSAGGGADFPDYQTVSFSATAPDGRAGYYEIIVFSDTETKAANWIKRVNW